MPGNSPEQELSHRSTGIRAILVHVAKERDLAQAQLEMAADLPVVKPASVRMPDAVVRSRRQPELDALRGFLLVWMTLNHLPTRVSYFTNQPLGFVSAAEGFIFLSALLTGRVFGRRLDEAGPADVWKRLEARVARLYGYHLFLLGIAFGVVATIAIHTKQPSLQGLVDFYLAHPLRAVVSSVLLIYRPPLLDILPMYILFLVGTPLALYIGRRWGWKMVLIPSVLIWIGAQFSLRVAAYNFTGSLTGFRIPFSAMGAFDLFGWQLLWIAGLWIGGGSPKILQSLPKSKLVLAIVVLVAAGFIYIRHSFLWNDLNTTPWLPFTDKWRLGVVRLCNFMALGILFSASQKFLARWFAVAPLVTLGKASLEVFCAHLLLCFAALAMVGDGSALAVAPQLAIIVCSLLGLYLVAVVSTRRQARAKVKTPLDSAAYS